QSRVSARADRQQGAGAHSARRLTPGAEPLDRAAHRKRRIARVALACDDAVEFRREPLPELDAPLIERVHVPDDALHEDLVLVERDELAERLGIEPLEQDQCAAAIPRIAAMRAVRLPARIALGE